MALKVLKRILSSKKPVKKAKVRVKAKPKVRILTAEGWKRRFGVKLLKAKKAVKK